MNLSNLCVIKSSLIFLEVIIKYLIYKWSLDLKTVKGFDLKIPRTLKMTTESVQIFFGQFLH